MARQGKMHSSPFHVESDQYKYAIEHEVDTRLLSDETLPSCPFYNKANSGCNKWNSGYKKCQSYHCAVTDDKFCREAICDSCGFYYQSTCYHQLNPPKTHTPHEEARFCCYYFSVDQDEKRFRYVRKTCYRYVLTRHICSIESEIARKKRSVNNLNDKIACGSCQKEEIEMASTKIRDLNSSICKREDELAALTCKIEKIGGRLTKLPWFNTRKVATSEKSTQAKKLSAGKKKKKKTVQKPWKYSPPVESWRFTIVYKNNSDE